MVQIGFKTDTGKKRDNNEDSLFLLPEQNIFMVADGVGGHNSGEIASMTAVKKIAEYIMQHPVSELEGEEAITRYFLQCLEHVNAEIYNTARENSELAGMATTVVILYLVDDKAYFVNVGDSRAYVIRERQLSQITEDHTYVNELLRKGSITSEEAAMHPQKNMITRALGGEEKVLPDFYQYKVCRNDVIILCSDGLYGEVGSDRITQMASEAGSMSKLSTELVDLANANGGSDNITIICIKI